MENLSNEVVLHQKHNGIEYIQFRKLLEYPEVEHCFTLRKNGLSFKTHEEDSNVLKENYQRIVEVFHWDKNKIVKPHQTHTDRIESVSNYMEKFNEVDGLLTNQKEIILCTTEADCTGLILYDPVQEVIGNVHSGWRGTLQRIGQKAVKKMIECYHSNPGDIICCICPHIRKCHFEVGEEVKELFEKEYRNIADIDKVIEKGKIVNGNGIRMQKYYIDTTLINIIMLQEIGLKPENIIDSGICTVCHADSFHSYRVDKEQSGRNATMVMLH